MDQTPGALVKQIFIKGSFVKSHKVEAEPEKGGVGGGVIIKQTTLRANLNPALLTLKQVANARFLLFVTTQQYGQHNYLLLRSSTPNLFLRNFGKNVRERVDLLCRCWCFNFRIYYRCLTYHNSTFFDQRKKK